MDLLGTGCGAVDFIHVALDRDKVRTFVKTVMNLQIPLYSYVGKFLGNWETVGFPTRTQLYGVS
jgi:hypothetical protein